MADMETITLGICCMNSKLTGKPMQAILRRLKQCGDLELIEFPEDDILEKPVEEWPEVRCLIAFESKGFPLQKCIEYCNLRSPTCINNVEAQIILESRCQVYNMLTAWCIPCPDHIIVEHDQVAPQGPNVLQEHDNFIVFNGKKIEKPFVEKPEDANRHDIYIYYPRSLGGGAKKLFRKVKDKSSEFDPKQNSIRRDGTYIYEPFLTTSGTDIKVYTCGASYVHAEARKAPTVDGKVIRAKDGKEVRYPVVLSHGEKMIAAFIVKAFRQNVCGFDILRTANGSFVCDVNGWSFVKGNQKYYNDCASLIRQHLLVECGMRCKDEPVELLKAPSNEELDKGIDVSNSFCFDHSTAEASEWNLRSVFVVMRHGDRRPKEKQKFKTRQEVFLKYFKNKSDTEVKLKTPEELEQLKDALLKTMKSISDSMSHMRSDIKERPGAGCCSSWAWIHNYFWPVEKVDDEQLNLKELESDFNNLELMIPVLSMQERFSGFERKIQIKATKFKGNKVREVQVIVKWGGELTVGGLQRAESLGRMLREQLYFEDPAGLLRLHSSFRHDFKIYSSQEGRCLITAAAFTKGFLELDGDIIPILVSLVHSEGYGQAVLDEPIPKKVRTSVKEQIEDMSEQMIARRCPPTSLALRSCVEKIGNPLKLLYRIKELAEEYILSISAAMKRCEQRNFDPEDEAHDDAVHLSDMRGSVPDPMIPFDLEESSKRMYLHLRRKENRWKKLYSGFVRKDKKGKSMFDTSKIPDIWDNLYYDLITHRNYLGAESVEIAEKMVGLVEPLAEWIADSEYGITEEEKVRIGMAVSWRLIGKCLQELEHCNADCKPGLPLDKPGFARRMLSRVISNPPGGGGLLEEPIRSTSPTTPKREHRRESLADGGGKEWREMAASSIASSKPNSPPPADIAQMPVEEGEISVMSVPSEKSEVDFTSKSLKRLTPEMRQNITRSLRDDSDWHPQVQQEVHKMAGLEVDMVRSRVFITSASTMHSLLNVLRYGEGKLAREGDRVIDLNYLSHIVIRCYQRNNHNRKRGKGDFRVEIHFSPGVQVNGQSNWTEGSAYVEENCSVAPLQLLGDRKLEEVEKALSALISSFADGAEGHQENGTDESH
ncbi:unnamed protein product [Durusdinium trenchii]|uniref:Inositol hexakisphosphate and diphosphoinositol-pentakisphosphate kinase n=1 Tax=Durusdinium trenchii TaxID=1381693 RepID=A0ABP0JJJ9_9DINO